MKFGLRDLDSHIAQRIREVIRNLWMMGFEQHSQPHDTERDRRLAARDVVQKGSSAISSTAGRWAASIGLGLITTVTAGLAGAHPAFTSIALFSLPPALYGFSWWVHKDGRIAEMERNLRAEELGALRSVIKATVNEGLYLEAAGRLLELGEIMSGHTAREILGELNDLLVQSRDLEGRRDALKSSMSCSLPDLLEKRADLQKRLDSVIDDMAKEATRQSLEMLDERLKDASALKPGLDRLEAQLEVIHQTLASVSAALARMKVAPEGSQPPDVEGILQSVADVRGQTRAVEQAVQEVMQATTGL